MIAVITSGIDRCEIFWQEYLKESSMLDYLTRLRHLSKYGLSCPMKLWRARQRTIKILESNGYKMKKDAPNPCRLYAYKNGEEFLLDILETHLRINPDVFGPAQVHILPIKWVGRENREPIVITDIPDSGHYGVWNTDSIHYEEVKQLCQN